MEKSKIAYSIEYDENSIRSEYRKEINDRILNISKYALPSYLIIIGGYFVYSDFFIRHISFVTLWRVPSLLFIVNFLILDFFGFWKTRSAFIAYNIILTSVCLMSAGMTWSLFNTPVFKSSIDGLLVAVFTIHIGTFRGVRMLFLHYVPILILILALFLRYWPHVSAMVEFGNVIGLVISCLIASQVEENLRFKEFRFRKIAEIERRKTEATLDHLKVIQDQLIQSEKLASLGELTAGIAHEIQNPLNFVNNFSGSSIDLAEELKEEVQKTEIDKELVLELATDLFQNQQKINLHGKRASNIVSVMLQHSRAGSSERVLTDINSLLIESIQLSYNIQLSKNKNFHVNTEKKLVESLVKINLIPQDISRVLVNIINNAFYSIIQRKMLLENGKADVNAITEQEYIPTVIVSSQKLDSVVEIRVSDNGLGVPENLKKKIFQPFFTTKPTGEGTGLGLSLSYDIVTKGHAGTLDFISKEGQGAAFIITLPLK